MGASHSWRKFLYWSISVRRRLLRTNRYTNNSSLINRRKSPASYLSGHLRHAALMPILFSLLIGISWRYDQHAILADNQSLANHGGLSRMETVYIPAVVASSPEAAVAATATIRPVPTIVVTPFPTFRPTEIATVGPTPTSTTVASDTLRFEGTSNQGQSVIIDTETNLSAVFKFEMDAQIICPNAAGPVELRVSDTNGFNIQRDRFQIRTPSRGGNEHMILGALESDGSRMSGTWSIWLDGPESLQPCNNKGEWSATQQVLQ